MKGLVFTHGSTPPDADVAFGPFWLAGLSPPRADATRLRIGVVGLLMRDWAFDLHPPFLPRVFWGFLPARPPRGARFIPSSLNIISTKPPFFISKNLKLLTKKNPLMPGIKQTNRRLYFNSPRPPFSAYSRPVLA